MHYASTTPAHRNQDGSKDLGPAPEGKTMHLHLWLYRVPRNKFNRRFQEPKFNLGGSARWWIRHRRNCQSIKELTKCLDAIGVQQRRVAVDRHYRLLKGLLGACNWLLSNLRAFKLETEPNNDLMRSCLRVQYFCNEAKIDNCWETGKLWTDLDSGAGWVMSSTWIAAPLPDGDVRLLINLDMNHDGELGRLMFMHQATVAYIALCTLGLIALHHLRFMNPAVGYYLLNVIWSSVRQTMVTSLLESYHS